MVEIFSKLASKLGKYEKILDNEWIDAWMLKLKSHVHLFLHCKIFIMN